MNESKPMFENVGVFLSHSHQDKNFARRLGNDLITRGVRVWIDNAEINVGDSLITKISEGLETMDYLAVILSDASEQNFDVSLYTERLQSRIERRHKLT